MGHLGRSRPARTLFAAVLVSACGLLGAWAALAAETRSTGLVSTGPEGGNGPYEADFAGATADGSQVFFWTEEPLVAGDANLVRDLYRRAAGATTQISSGPGGSGAQVGASEFGAVTADGGRVFFATDAPLAKGDSDEALDVYEFSGSNDVTLISTGPAAKKAVEEDAEYAGSSSDGTRVFFETAEKLVEDDSDESVDVYERSGGVTTLLSVGPGGEEGQGSHDTEFAAASADGSRVFLKTLEPLVSADEDTGYDVYERAGGETTLVSLGGEANLASLLTAISPNGARVVFVTPEPLLPGDEDEAYDVYERFAGILRLVSVGPVGGNANSLVAFDGASADATRIFFRTGEKLVEGDTDNAYDVYERHGGLTTQVSVGPAGGNAAGMHAVSAGVSQDGDHVFFLTVESLVEADTDSAQDLYERAGGITTLVSIGPAGGGSADIASYSGNSADGTRVIFRTQESLVAADGDEELDLYERAGGVTTLVSTGAEGGNGEEPASFAGSSSDGSRVFFETAESLLGGDSDVAKDLYVSTVDEPAPEEPGPGDPTPPEDPESPEDPEPRTPRCFGKPATIVGTARRDVLKGTRKRDVIVARGGNDKILGFAGNDLICAGNGKDVVLAGAGNDKVAAGAGADKAFGQGGSDRIFGQGGPDLLFGNAGRDLLNGGARKDRCRGGAGRDRLRRCER